MAITQGTVKFKIVMNRGAAGTPVYVYRPDRLCR